MKALTSHQRFRENVPKEILTPHIHTPWLEWCFAWIVYEDITNEISTFLFPLFLPTSIKFLEPICLLKDPGLISH